MSRSLRAILAILLTTIVGLAGTSDTQTSQAIVVIEPTQPVPAGFSIEKRDALSKWSGLASAIVFEAQLALQLQASDWQLLKAGLLKRTSVYVVGKDALGVVVKGLALPLTVPKFVEDQVYGEGVFLNVRGIPFTDHLVSGKPVSTARAFEWVQESVAMRLPEVECPTKRGWKEMPGKEATFEDRAGDGRELWQRVEYCRREQPDPKGHMVWRVKITSETRPQKDKRAKDIQTSEHKKRTNLDSSRSRDCQGPGSVGSNQVATVRLNCPSAQDESTWTWQTGNTRLNEDAPPQRLRVDWRVEYTRDSAEAKASYRWLPGVQTGAGEQISMSIRNEITWFHPLQQLPKFLAIWEPGSP